jgi:predicted PurR-regulated permease PerM
LAADAITFVIALVVMVLALYYLFADGEKLAREVQRLSPLEDEDGLTLFGQFENICRGVVLSSVVAAIVQGVFAGIGFAIVGVERIWLLAILTMFFSLIPFLGAAAVWICVAVVLLFEQRFGAAIFLGIYGTIVVSTSDNLIKAYVIGDRAQMHPFVVLITVLGALQLVGLWGIFIGPMTAAFFYALLNILRSRLLEEGEGPSHATATVSEGSQ